MRILIAGTTYLPARNGQAIFTTNLAEGLAQRGHDVCMVYPSELGKPYQEMRNGVQIRTSNSISLRKWHPNAYLTPFPEYDATQNLDAFQPELVHIQDHYWLSHAFVTVARKRKIKLLGTNHFMPENLAPYVPWLAKIQPLFNNVLWGWMLITYQQVNMVTVQSRASASLLQAQGLQLPVWPVSCGIDLGRFRYNPQSNRDELRQKFKLSKNRTVFLFVGRVDREKKLDLLLQAVHQLKRPDIEVAIAGTGAAFAELKKLSASLELEDQVRFLGYIPDNDLPDLLNCADIFVMPSQAELLSIASLEAMACGRPLLLADAVALPELVSNGENGYLFTPGSLESLSQRICDLADHPEQWDSMREASIRRAEAHGLQHVLNRYEEIYRMVLA